MIILLHNILVVVVYRRRGKRRQVVGSPRWWGELSRFCMEEAVGYDTGEFFAAKFLETLLPTTPRLSRIKSGSRGINSISHYL